MSVTNEANTLFGRELLSLANCTGFQQQEQHTSSADNADMCPQRFTEHSTAQQQMQHLQQQRLGAATGRSNSPFSTSRSVSPQPIQYSAASAAVTSHMLQWQKHQQWRSSSSSSSSPVRSVSAPVSLQNGLGMYNPYATSAAAAQQLLLGGHYHAGSYASAGYMHHQPLHAAALLAAAAAAPVAIPLPLPAHTVPLAHAHHHSAAAAAAAAHTAAQQQYAAAEESWAAVQSAAAAAARAVRGWSTASNGGSTASNSPLSAPVRGGKGTVSKTAFTQKFPWCHSV
jgi:hypothetical protein